MKRTKLAIVGMVMMVITCAAASADRLFSVTSAYSMPIGNDKVDPSLSIGVDYRFWGVFEFSFNMYNNIVLGADNILNIKRIEPIGLFSGGVGMKIPLGGFHLLLDWQKYFTGTAASDGVYPFSDSYAFGVSLDLSPSFTIEVNKRSLYNFSPQAIRDSALRVESENDTVDILALGVAVHLF